MANSLLFVAGFAAGIFFFALAHIPLLYGAPKAAYWALRGVIRWRAVLNFLAAAFFWQAAAVGVFLALVKFAPGVLLFVAGHPGWAWEAGSGLASVS
jgi:hypothetical protein